MFVIFAYCTGARSGKIRSVKRKIYSPIYKDAYCKSGRRLIKLNNQAQEILSGLDKLWVYIKDFVSHKFK